MTTLYYNRLECNVSDILNDVWIVFMGKGQNYEFHNVKIQKERRKKFKASERQNCLFSFSLLWNQNVKNGFLVDQNVENE